MWVIACPCRASCQQQLIELIVTCLSCHTAIVAAAPGRPLGPEYCVFNSSVPWRSWNPRLTVCVPNKLYVHMDEMEVFTELRDVLVAMSNNCRVPDRWMTRAAIRAFGYRDTSEIRCARRAGVAGRGMVTVTGVSWIGT